MLLLVKAQNGLSCASVLLRNYSKLSHLFVFVLVVNILLSQ